MKLIDFQFGKKLASARLTVREEVDLCSLHQDQS
jgi:hypothetical protein